jgi:hypothetical protein
MHGPGKRRSCKPSGTARASATNLRFATVSVRLGHLTISAQHPQRAFTASLDFSAQRPEWTRACACFCRALWTPSCSKARQSPGLATRCGRTCSFPTSAAVHLRQDRAQAAASLHQRQIQPECPAALQRLAAPVLRLASQLTELRACLEQIASAPPRPGAQACAGAIRDALGALVEQLQPPAYASLSVCLLQSYSLARFLSACLRERVCCEIVCVCGGGVSLSVSHLVYGRLPGCWHR